MNNGDWCIPLTLHVDFGKGDFGGMNRDEDLDVVRHGLTLLRKYGWEIGYRKLTDWLPETQDEPARTMHELFLGWRAWESGRDPEANEHFQSITVPPLLAYAMTGRGFTAMRAKGLGYKAAAELFDQAADAAPPDDFNLQALIAHGRGSVLYHQGQPAAARRCLGEALALAPEDETNFLTPRLYDTLGMTWSRTGNFYAASEMYAKSLKLRSRRPLDERDLPGMALTHGQLGRLYLDWGLLDQAESHFREDLKLSQRLDDQRGQTQMYNFLGLVALRKAERSQAQGQRTQFAEFLKTAKGWLDACVELAETQSAHNPAFRVLAGYGLKDRALAALAEADTQSAERDLTTAAELFAEREFAEGLASIHLACGILERLRANLPESERLLRLAIHHFDGVQIVELGRTLLELARTYRDAQKSLPLVIEAYSEALDTAEACRRPLLVQEIETDLESLDALFLSRRKFQRVRGRGVPQSTISLMEAQRETGTVLYLDIQGSTAFAHHRDPQEVMLIINELMADLAAVLRMYDGQVSAFRGDGFLALFRGAECGERAVHAALDLITQVQEFNEPRRLLGEDELIVRTGVATGGLCFGNVGTYDKMDFTTIGTPANLGARLESQARPEEGKPCCICQQTRESVGDRFQFSEDSPVTLNLKGLGQQRFWFVLDRTGDSTRPA